jgi:hypothetical protein
MAYTILRHGHLKGRLELIQLITLITIQFILSTDEGHQAQHINTDTCNNHVNENDGRH